MLFLTLAKSGEILTRNSVTRGDMQSLKDDWLTDNVRLYRIIGHSCTLLVAGFRADMIYLPA